MNFLRKLFGKKQFDEHEFRFRKYRIAGITPISWEKEYRTGRRYEVYRGRTRSVALEFLRSIPTTEIPGFVYIIVKTPQGNIGRGLIGIFDEATGDIIEIPSPAITNTAQNRQWELNSNSSGDNKYFEQKAENLYQATEILKSISTIPNLTYYVVETPDGTLGRDMNGFYTEAAIKTKDIVVESRQSDLETVECSSLMGFGNINQNHTAVAQIIETGQYAKVVLLMKCGNCGYESPVETQAGSFSRECYHCGVANKCHRAAINVYLGGSKMIEI